MQFSPHIHIELKRCRPLNPNPGLCRCASRGSVRLANPVAVYLGSWPVRAFGVISLHDRTIRVNIVPCVHTKADYSLAEMECLSSANNETKSALG